MKKTTILLLVYFMCSQMNGQNLITKKIEDVWIPKSKVSWIQQKNIDSIANLNNKHYFIWFYGGAHWDMAFLNLIKKGLDTDIEQHFLSFAFNAFDKSKIILNKKEYAFSKQEEVNLLYKKILLDLKHKSNAFPAFIILDNNKRIQKTFIGVKPKEIEDYIKNLKFKDIDTSVFKEVEKDIENLIFDFSKIKGVEFNKKFLLYGKIKYKGNFKNNIPNDKEGVVDLTTVNFKLFKIPPKKIKGNFINGKLEGIATLFFKDKANFEIELTFKNGKCITTNEEIIKWYNFEYENQ